MNFVVHLDYRTELGPARDQGARPTCVAHASTTLTNMPVDRNCRCHPSTCTTSRLQTTTPRTASTSPRSPAPSSTRDNRPRPIARIERTSRRPNGRLPRTSSLYRRSSTSGAPNPAGVEALLNAGRLPVLGIATTSAFYDPTPPWVMSHADPIVGFHARRGRRCRNGLRVAWFPHPEQLGNRLGGTPVTRGSMTRLSSGICKRCWC